MLVPLLSGCSDDRGAKEQEAQKMALEERPLLIGVVGPETGEEAHFGTSVVEGVLAAAKRFNAQGGIAGKQIKVLHFDDQGNLELTDKIVKDLIHQKAIAILAAPTGSSTFAPVHLVNEAKTLFVSVGSRRHLKRSGPYVFRTAVPDETATEDLIKYAKSELGYSNYALVTASDNDFSLDMSSMFKKALEKQQGSIGVEADTYDTYSGSHNMAAVVAAIKKSRSNLHGVIFTGGASEALLLARALRKAGSSLPLIGGEDLFTDEYLKGGDAINQTLLYATFSADSKSAQMDEFLASYGKAGPDRFAALAYDSFLLIAEAIKAAGSTDTSKVRQAMIERKDFLGATGKTSFSSENAPAKNPLLFRTEKLENGTQAFVRKQ